LAHVLRVT